MKRVLIYWSWNGVGMSSRVICEGIINTNYKLGF